MKWLLEASARAAIEANQSAVISAEDRRSYVASINDMKIASVSGSTATIKIEGVLTKKPDVLALLFGGGNTTYKQITDAVNAAEQAGSIKDIVLEFDSPGGEVDGLIEAMEAVGAVTKPTTAVVQGLCASAAYGLASQADEIIAASKASRIGSVGVAVAYYEPAKVVSVTNTESPDKRPDVTTDEGKAVVREELDEIYSLFAEGIAKGRGVDVEVVNSNYGRGKVFLAEKAKKWGMIESIGLADLRETANSGGKQELKAMDLNELKAQHPAVYQAAVDVGVKQERDRVCAHLIMGEKAGAMDVAAKAITEGEGMTATLQATYMTAGMNRSDTQARLADEPSATDNVSLKADEAETDSDKVVAFVEKQMGVANV